MQYIKAGIKRLHPDAKTPVYATPGSACFDLFVTPELTEEVVLTQDTPLIIGTGLAVEVPPGYVMEVFSRSGHGFKYDVLLANGTGIIDSDYRGELVLKLAADGAPFTVKPNERIAQGRIVPAPRTEFYEIEELSETERKGGLGHTGR